MEEVLYQLGLVAALVERTVQFLKTAAKYNQWAGAYQQYIDIGLSVVFNILLCLSWGVDLFKAADLTFPYAWIGATLTGALASLGSSIVHEFVELLKLWRAGGK